jgi:hypothetical protein
MHRLWCGRVSEFQFLSVRQETEGLARVYQKLVASKATPASGHTAPVSVCEVSHMQ